MIKIETVAAVIIFCVVCYSLFSIITKKDMIVYDDIQPYDTHPPVELPEYEPLDEPLYVIKITFKTQEELELLQSTNIDIKVINELY
ncbi:MAG: hypothetical protein PVF58_10015 [Candidatus Methanofastidiosia archaeon]